MRRLKESEVTTFKSWWEQNKAVYEKLNIDQEIAATIWYAAVDAAIDAVSKSIE